MASHPDPASRFWRATRRVTLLLLVAWLLLNLAVPWFARDLHTVQGLGFPLGFWLAAQGALLVYVAIILVYAVVMNRLEQRYLQDAAAEPSDSANGANSANSANGTDSVDHSRGR